MNPIQPAKPAVLDPLAVEILEALEKHPEAGRIVLGGHFALKHYVDFRVTHGIRAWWAAGRNEAALDAVRGVMRNIAGTHGLTLAEREWGDVVSLELKRADVAVFSFQIASRSVDLESALPAPWPPLLIESLADNLGAKMNALVNRGAPRDFVDIFTVIDRGICTASECWDLWARKNPRKAPEDARRQIRRHLESIEHRRPLDGIAATAQRATAEKIRRWFRETFL